jgi:hypothetical protein
MVDQAGLQNLRLQDVIVTPGGTPTQYFMRLLQGKSTNSADVQAQIEAILMALTEKADKIIVLTAGTGLTGGGDLSAGRSFAIDTTAEAERIRDVIGTALVAGANITITVDDPGDTITIAASGGGGGGGLTEPGSENFLPHIDGSDVFGSGFYGGTVIYFPDAANLDAVKFFSRSTAAGAVMTPAIYAVSASGVLGSLVADGPSVTGAVPGIISLPLTAPYAVTAGESLVVGFVLQVSNLTVAKTKVANSVHFAHGTSVPPASPAFSLNTFNWSSMWANLT